MFKLVIQDDGGKTTVVPLIRDEITIGRKEGNTIRLTERNVSRKHARIVRTNGSITIEDLDSYNGIKVNGNRIDGRCGIAEADRVQIGDYLIEVKSEAKAGAAAPEESDDAETRPHPTLPMPEIAPPSNGASIDPMAETPLPSVEAGPTIETPAVTPTPESSSPPRLVCLSTNFAGQEFLLDGNAMVIGRLEENGIPINHRSISKTHAKVIMENGRWSIVDLQSANGVRVNGEDYGKVELRRGDIIDLGHVRLRFVEAGEDFVFGRDAHPVDIGGNDRPRAFGWIIAAALLLGIAGAIFFLSQGGDEKEAGGKATDDIDAQVAVKPLAAIDAAPVVEDPADAGEEPGVAVKETLTKAKAAIDNRDWQAALAAANEVLAQDPNHAEAKALKETADRESANQSLYEAFKEAVVAKKVGDIANTFKKIPADSVYRAMAEPQHRQAKEAYSDRVMGRARELGGKGKCAELRKLARNVAVVRPWSDIASAVSRVKCRKTDGGTTPTKDPKDPPPKNGGDEVSKKERAKVLSREAGALIIKGQWGAARLRCEEALKLDSRNLSARSACTLAGCNLKKRSVAQRHFKRLPPGRQAMALDACAKQGIILK